MNRTQRYATSAALLALLLVGVAPKAHAQAAGSCTIGRAENTLDINNVRAAIFNTGSLFFGGSRINGDGYYVPKAALRSPVFASGIWIGGKVNGALRLAGARYGNYNFWPGPLGADGRPVNPSNCGTYDRIFSVTKDEIATYNGTGVASEDLRDWPYQLGAPVVDGDGVADNYNLAGGDRPEILGDQGIWWVMNDVGNTHAGSGTPPIGVEVQVLAFAFARADALGSTTFYRYRVINKGPNPVTDTYLSVFSDPDLGDAADDYVGYDQDLSMGFVYNSDAVDGGGAGYGIPPAAGYDFFQGPIVPDGPDAGSDPDTLGATRFSYFQNVGSGPTADPSLAEPMYFFQQGLWGDGTPMRALSDGYGEAATVPITLFAFPGDPVTNQAWSEVNNGTATPANASGDRRFLISTGPFTLEPNTPQDIVFGIAFAQGSDRFSSITALRAADRLAQQAYDIGFALPPPPPPPPACTEATSGSGECAEVVSQDGRVTLVWGYPETSDNYLGQFETEDLLLRGQGATDSTYNFEGFNIYRYPTSAFQADQRELIATFDVINGVTRVVDNVFDSDLGAVRPQVVLRATDSGLRYSLVIPDLVNNTDYYYGITAFAYNEESSPKIIESSATQLTARPSRLAGGLAERSLYGDSLGVTAVQAGEGIVTARVADPTRLTGDTYEVRFFNPLRADGTTDTGVTTYNVINTTTGAVAIDGQAYYTRTGQALPTGNDVAIVDGFAIDVNGPPPGINAFVVVSNASGPLNPVEEAVAGFSNPAANFPHGLLTGGADRPTEAQQVGPAEWFIHQGSQVGTDQIGYANWFNLVLRNDNFERVGASDFEWRFTATGGKAINFQTGAILDVPFEFWNIGVATPDDPSDDVRLVPEVLDDFPVAGQTAGSFNLGNRDHGVSGGDNDPYTDRVYIYEPTNMSPGQAGYNAVIAGTEQTGGEVFARLVLVNWNGGSITAPAAYNQALPEAGTTFRIITAKPNQPGDVFTISTADRQLTTPTAAEAEASLEQIQVVPNPYFAASSYESGNASRLVRFTNLPEAATTVRIYTVAGTLVRTLSKDGANRQLDWDLTTQNNLPVASGMYLIHIDVEGIGERVLKFGVVQRRTQIDVF